MESRSDDGQSDLHAGSGIQRQPETGAIRGVGHRQTRKPAGYNHGDLRQRDAAAAAEDRPADGGSRSGPPRWHDRDAGGQGNDPDGELHRRERAAAENNRRQRSANGRMETGRQVAER